MDSRLTSAASPPRKAGGKSCGAHVLLCPFPGSGHIIPFLDLARQFLSRGLTLTIWVAPQNLKLLEPLLAAHPSSLEPLLLSPPEPTSPSLTGLIRSISALDEPIKKWFGSHHNPPVAIVSDLLMGWTHRLACQLGVPRIVFYTSGALAMSTCNSLWRDLPTVDDPENLESVVSLPKIPNSPTYPWWQMHSLYRSYMRGDPDGKILRDALMANMASWGTVFNSFSELEGEYIDHVRKESGHDRMWAVGPLLPNGEDSVGPMERGGASSVPAQEVLTWLDPLAENSVVYVCFGSWHVVDSTQVAVLAAALELSGVRFVWCIRIPEERQAAEECRPILDGFEGRVAGRGLVIKGWAPQVAILRHRAVGSFLTHCGWNSTLEGIAAGVVMLTWPMVADQFMNAKLLVDELGVGIPIGEGTRRTPESGELARILAESVDGPRAEPTRVRAMDLREEAWRATKGGSSARDMDALVKMLGELRFK